MGRQDERPLYWGFWLDGFLVLLVKTSTRDCSSRDVFRESKARLLIARVKQALHGRRWPCGGPG